MDNKIKKFFEEYCSGIDAAITKNKNRQEETLEQIAELEESLQDLEDSCKAKQKLLLGIITFYESLELYLDSSGDEEKLSNLEEIPTLGEVDLIKDFFSMVNMTPVDFSSEIWGVNLTDTRLYINWLVGTEPNEVSKSSTTMPVSRKPFHLTREVSSRAVETSSDIKTFVNDKKLVLLNEDQVDEYLKLLKNAEKDEKDFSSNFCLLSEETVEKAIWDALQMERGPMCNSFSIGTFQEALESYVDCDVFSVDEDFVEFILNKTDLVTPLLGFVGVWTIKD